MSEARRRATYEDILALPDNVVGEIIDGELVVSARPAPRHAQASSYLSGELHPYRQRTDDPSTVEGWWILSEPELHFGSDVLVPDLAGWRYERMPALPDEAYFSLAPDWVCEVLSPSTCRKDRTEKMPLYAKKEVDYLWLIDPVARTLEAYCREGLSYQEVQVFHDDMKAHIPPFLAVEIDLAALWRC